MAVEYVISSEQDAWDLLEKFDQGEGNASDEAYKISFKGWPNLDLRFVGNDFHQSVPTRVMPPLLDAQREIHKLFCEMVYGTSDTRRMTYSDRSRLELVVKVDKGSSKLNASLADQLTDIAREAITKMDGQQAVITILGSALLLTSVVSWKAWLAKKSKDKEIESRIELSKIEAERQQSLTDVIKNQPILKNVSNGFDDFRNHSLSKLEQADKFELPGSSELISGEEAHEITTAKREQSIEVRLDGEFVILSVDSGGTKGFRLKVQHVVDKQVMTVSIPDGTLSKDEKEVLQKNEWAKLPIHLEINAKELRGEITTATLVKASKIKKKK